MAGRISTNSPHPSIKYCLLALQSATITIQHTSRYFNDESNDINPPHYLFSKGVSCIIIVASSSNDDKYLCNCKQLMVVVVVDTFILPFKRPAFQEILCVLLHTRIIVLRRRCHCQLQ